MVSSGRGMFCGAGGDLKQSGMSESLPELLEEDVDIIIYMYCMHHQTHEPGELEAIELDISNFNSCLVILHI